MHRGGNETMPRPSEHRPAKVARPRLHGAIPRGALHALLDASVAGAVWIAAPPGAGKTTAIAGYLDAGRLDGIWYQVDAGDDDPATFFYYLRCAAHLASKSRRAARLPLFTPEFQYDLPGFARRFFRDLYALMGPEAVIVLDNIQDVPVSGAFHGIIAEAIEALPDGTRLIAISREPPPPPHARLLANGRIRRLDWDAIRYSAAETALIVRANLEGATDNDVTALHVQSGGWAAGLTLLMEQARRGERVADLMAPGNLQDVFDYFASQVLARATDEERHALLHLAWLPRIRPDIAATLTGNARAERLLDRLYRRHLFTHRRPLDPPDTGRTTRESDRYVYQFHALFQAFLQHRAEATWTPEVLRFARQTCAGLLEAHLEFEDAFQLYAAAEDWAPAEALIAGQAPVLLATGRWKTLLDWTGAIPRARIAGNASLLLWRGRAMSASSPVDARSILERAFETAEACDEAGTKLQAAASMIDTYLLEYTNFFGIDRWIPVVVDALQAAPRIFDDVDTEILVQCAALNAMTFRRPAHPYREECVERVLQLVHEARDASVAMGAIGALLLHAGLTGRVTLGRRIEPMFPAIEARPDLRPHVLAVAQFALAFYYHIDILRDRTRMRRCIAELDRIADEDGLSYVRCFADMMRYMSASLFTSEQQALQAIRSLEVYRQSGRPFDVGAVHNGYAWHGAASGNAGMAIDNARPVIELWEATGSVYHGAISYLPLIWGLHASGQSAAASGQLSTYSKTAIESDMPVLEAGRLAAAAILALDASDQALADRHLHRLMDLTMTHGCMHVVAWMPDWFHRLMIVAADRDIAPDFALECLDKCRGWAFPPPPETTRRRPIPIRVFTLGRFAVHRNGRPITLARKAPRRMLALLKCLIARGGTGVACARLIEDLWPESDGDRASSALRTALHRLRDFLGDADAIVVTDGAVSMDPTRVWVDALAFRSGTGSPVEADPGDARSELYRGVFLPNDMDAAWSATMRQRCRLDHERRLLAVGRDLELSGRFDDALDLYRRGIGVDDLMETFHRGQMRCLAKLGREAEALAEYSRLRKTLATRLAAAPSSETSMLAETIRAGQNASTPDA
jgi:LuxR family maltose regulon positive regulatory protein